MPLPMAQLSGLYNLLYKMDSYWAGAPPGVGLEALGHAC